MTIEVDAGPVEEFASNRGLLLGVAYRMLGSVDDVEDVVQETWLRWSRADRSEVVNAQSYLVQIVTRLSLDRLRRVKAQRETYLGPWLPEPLPTVSGTEESAELAESVSVAMLVVLETLSPLERVVFVLREAFDFSMTEIAEITGRSVTAVRQLSSRARAHVAERRPRFGGDVRVQRMVTERFLAASLGADLDGLLELLAPEVTLCNDGNGLRGAPRIPVRGAERVGRNLVFGIQKFLPTRAMGAAWEATVVEVNGARPSTSPVGTSRDGDRMICRRCHAFGIDCVLVGIGVPLTPVD
jgi:RNA polymerase sigma-70 factor, ECF subfamily